MEDDGRDRMQRWKEVVYRQSRLHSRGARVKVEGSGVSVCIGYGEGINIRCAGEGGREWGRLYS